jgi:hypothetical protein
MSLSDFMEKAVLVSVKSNMCGVVFSARNLISYRHMLNRFYNIWWLFPMSVRCFLLVLKLCMLFRGIFIIFNP